MAQWFWRFLNVFNDSQYVSIISPWKRAWPFICTKLNPLYPRMFLAKFGWICARGYGEYLNKSNNVFSLCRYHLPLEKSMGLHLQNLNTLYSRMLFVKLVEISPVVLEMFFLKSSMFFYNVAITSPWKRTWLFIYTNLKSPYQGCFLQSFVEIGTVVLEKMTMIKVYRFTDRRTDDQERSTDLHSVLNGLNHEDSAIKW